MNEEEEDVSWTFMPVDHQYEAFLRYKEKYEPHAKLVWSIEANSFWEAEARYHEFMGRAEPVAQRGDKWWRDYWPENESK
ncbi:MAG: hypothetical protein JO360_08985 [Acidobacteria bacterium]|nr:hypothetical protein [Acidobacteriota bacterium]